MTAPALLHQKKHQKSELRLQRVEVWLVSVQIIALFPRAPSLPSSSSLQAPSQQHWHKSDCDVAAATLYADQYGLAVS